MKGAIATLFFLSLIPTMAASTESVDSVERGPRAEFVNKTIDFGAFDGDSIQEGIFVIVNNGTDTLAIKSVFADCGCTVPSYQRRPVAPGDSSMIRVRFDGRNRQPGSFRKVIRVRSNALNPTAVGFIKGSIRRKYKR